MNQMEYPEEFPPESRAAVAAEKLRAGKDFDDARKSLQGTQYDAGQDLEAELRKHILRQFGVFVKEACKLRNESVWQVDRVEEESLEFLRRTTIDAIYKKGYDNSGRAFGRNWLSNWGGGIEPDVKRQFERSEEWQQFQDALLQVAEAQAARASEAGKETGAVTRNSLQSERNGRMLSGAGDAAMPAPELTIATIDDEPDRTALVDAFLRRCNGAPGVGFRVMRKHIWEAAGHAHARQFQYWQDGSDKATDVDDRNFRRILRMSPEEFFALLEKMGFYPSSS